jgi:para-nitrobenzyl esterase
MTRSRKLSTLLFLTATALAGVAVPSAPGLAAPGGIPGPNPDAPGQIKKANGPTVSTGDGPVQGFVQNGAITFLGIPYAAPPVGALRWMPPAPPGSHPLLDATQFANSCPQVTELGAFAGPSSTNEDCLYLNVFTPSLKGSNAVLVWIHGGGNVDGETADYDASKEATGGPLGSPTVVVTINYRLGLFGWLSETHLNSEGHPWGNYGNLDQQAALRWVQANIASFGGDPTRVALGGQSAGAQDTGVAVLMPSDAGLFNRAIYESSPLSSLPTAATALTRGNAFAAAAGCSDSTCLRKLSAARILQLQGTPNAGAIDPIIHQPYTIGPFVDGTIVPHQPETAWTSGAYNHMPTMGGAVRDEGNFGLSITEYFTGPPQVALTAAQYLANNPANVLAEYPLSNYGGNAELAQDRVSTDPGKCRGLHVLNLWAPAIQTFGYDFSYQNSPYYFPQMPNALSPTGYFQPLAYHTSDIQYQFFHWHGGNLGVNINQGAISPANNQPRDLQGAEVTLSDQLVAAWTNFTKTGNPNGTGAPLWPVFTTGAGPFLQQDIPNSAESVTQFRAFYKCDFWDPLQVYPTG